MINYKFQNQKLLEEALIHPSLTEIEGKNYERLEFLGDRVLGMVIADILFNNYPESQEGDLAIMYANLVNSACLTNLALKLNLDELIKTDGDKNNLNPKLLENCIEAVIGAIYLDGGYHAAKEFISHHWKELFSQKNNLMTRDPKSSLQEWAQKRHYPLPQYEVISRTGPSHKPFFTIEISISGLGKAQGSGYSKKKAELDAAKKLLDKINDE